MEARDGERVHESGGGGAYRTVSVGAESVGETAWGCLGWPRPSIGGTRDPGYMQDGPAAAAHRAIRAIAAGQRHGEPHEATHRKQLLPHLVGGRGRGRG
jgi:hypothetical protein